MVCDETVSAGYSVALIAITVAKLATSKVLSAMTKTFLVINGFNIFSNFDILLHLSVNMWFALTKRNQVFFLDFMNKKAKTTTAAAAMTKTAMVRRSGLV